MKKIMKKIMSLCLAAMLLIGACAVPSYASDTDMLPSDRQIRSGEDALELACKIWPEYEDKLLWKDVKPLTRSAAENNEIVVQKTHQLSENESITYVEYENGLAVVFANSNWDEGTHTSGSGYDEYSGGFYVASGMSTAHLLNFRYRINHSGYDRIISKGTMYTVKANVYDHGFDATESASGPAYYTYQVYFVDDWGNLYGSTIVNLNVSNNKFSWSTSS